jgi:hypothetical protein
VRDGGRSRQGRNGCGLEGRRYVIENDDNTYFIESCFSGRTEYLVCCKQPGHDPIEEAGRAFLASFKGL